MRNKWNIISIASTSIDSKQLIINIYFFYKLYKNTNITYGDFI